MPPSKQIDLKAHESSLRSVARSDRDIAERYDRLAASADDPSLELQLRRTAQRFRDMAVYYEGRVSRLRTNL